MKIKFRYLLILFLFLYTRSSYAKVIFIDSTFSFTDIYNSLLNDKPTSSEVILTVNIKNTLTYEQQLYLSIINPTLDNIVIYEDTGFVILGDLIPFTKRDFKHNNHVYPVLLKANENKKITLKVLKQWQPVNFRVNLSSQNHFIKTTNHDNFFSGIFYGIMFMFLLLLICFYIFSRSNFFLIYLSINCFMLLLFLQYNGLGYQFIWFYSTSLQKYIGAIAITGYFTTHVYFIRTFFTTQFNTNFTGFILKSLLVIVLFFGVITFIQLYNRSYGNYLPNLYYILLNALMLFYGILVSIISLYTYKESKRREIIWVFIGMLLHISNWIIFLNNDFAIFKPLNLLSNYKIFESNNFIPQINFLIMLTEIFVVTIFISINYHKLIRENNISSRRLSFLQKRNINTFVLGQEEEREKITEQIAVDISNDILHLKKSLQHFKQADEKKIIPAVLHDIDKTLEDIHNITSNYVAPNMQQMLLSELILTATDKIFTETDLKYDFSRIPEQFKLNAVANISLYRILQEISNNILKHAHAKNVTITIIKDSKSLQIKITDDGVGFADFTPKNKGIGLMNIESRMNSLNGNFYVMSNVKIGSTIHLIMPLKEIC